MTQRVPLILLCTFDVYILLQNPYFWPTAVNEVTTYNYGKSNLKFLFMEGFRLSRAVQYKRCSEIPYDNWKNCLIKAFPLEFIRSVSRQEILHFIEKNSLYVDVQQIS